MVVLLLCNSLPDQLSSWFHVSSCYYSVELPLHVKDTAIGHVGFAQKQLQHFESHDLYTYLTVQMSNQGRFAATPHGFTFEATDKILRCTRQLWPQEASCLSGFLLIQKPFQHHVSDTSDLPERRGLLFNSKHGNLLLGCSSRLEVPSSHSQWKAEPLELFAIRLSHWPFCIIL